jgi:hypothetical protein
MLEAGDVMTSSSRLGRQGLRSLPA